jgi:hypothetical protein
MLARLTGSGSPYERMSELQADLAATQRLPVEATPALRSLHVAILVFTLSIGLSSMFLWARIAAVARLMDLDVSLLHSTALLRALDEEEGRGAPHATRPRTSEFRELLERQQARDRAEQELRWRNLDLLGRMTAAEARRQRLRTDASVQCERLSGEQFAVRAIEEGGDSRFVVVVSLPGLQQAEDRASGTVGPESLPWSMLATCAINLLLFPLLWTGWDFVTRGGLSLRLVGLGLVRRDGRDARRWQCAWRTLLVWLPVVALLGTVIALDVDAPERGATCAVLQWLALAWVVGAAVVAVWSPRRGPHDWLAGTYVVPR